ncbi:MAG: hypothetical protein M1826_000496 [Phylliscum demangeonii]|nr:MAG: hypothetical protein M1826_000496 [Phylliscum demangeonii]
MLSSQLWALFGLLGAVTAATVGLPTQLSLEGIQKYLQAVLQSERDGMCTLCVENCATDARDKAYLHQRWPVAFEAVSEYQCGTPCTKRLHLVLSDVLQHQTQTVLPQHIAASVAHLPVEQQGPTKKELFQALKQAPFAASKAVLGKCVYADLPAA